MNGLLAAAGRMWTVTIVALASCLCGVSAGAASAPQTLLPYGSPFTYKQVTHGELLDFQSPEFRPDATWADGNAPFGGGSGYYCGPSDSQFNTKWESNTDLLLRHVLVVPPGAYSVLVHVEVDNDAQVFWDGQDISNGVRTHDQCATQDDIGPFPVPPGPLLSPQHPHVLAVRAIDRGLLTRLDVSVSYLMATVPRPLVKSATWRDGKLRIALESIPSGATLHAEVAFPHHKSIYVTTDRAVLSRHTQRPTRALLHLTEGATSGATVSVKV